MTDLDAIRARDALTPQRWFPNQLPAERQAREDRRALLAVVDRLTARLESRGLRYSEGIEDERARIRAAVEAGAAALQVLIAHGRYETMDPRRAATVAIDDLRAAVLAAIDGEAT